MIHRIRTIDAHAAGEPLRLIVDGFPTPKGATMLEKREWVRRRADHLRRALMLEPRGHLDMYGALLTMPVEPTSHAGVLFMHNEGYSTMCGHGVIAVVTIALERGLLPAPPEATAMQPPSPGASAGQGPPSVVLLDTPAGPVRATARLRDGRVERVSFINVPSFVLHAALPVAAAGRQMKVDVAFGGAFYAIVDSEAAGVPLDGARLPDLRRIGMEIKRAIEAIHRIVHPVNQGLEGIYGTIFTAPPRRPDADLRNVTVFADAEVDRSPCGTGTCAVLAVLDRMGLTADDRPFVHESIVGTVFHGRVVGRTQVGDYEAIVPEIEGSAWITGEHTFLIDDEDPLREGFRL